MKSSNNQVRLGRNRKPFWIIATAVISALAIAVVGQTILKSSGRYWVVKQDTPSGARLAASMLEPVAVDLAASSGVYLQQSQAPTGFLSHALQAGELLTANNVTKFSLQDQTRVVVTTSAGLSQRVGAGTNVQLWSADKLGNEVGAVNQLLETAEVVRLIETKGMFSQQQQQVELQIDNLELPAVLDALASGANLYLVPNS
ncbi:MAG: hypothetical protein RL556_398 [Actinomycetota bacterium]|jgi:hypothetical protein